MALSLILPLIISPWVTVYVAVTVAVAPGNRDAIAVVPPG